MIDQQIAFYAILVIGVGYSLLSTFIIQKLGNPKKVKAIQEESTQLSKEMSAAVKAKDERRIEEINKRYEAYFPKMSELMILQMKPLIIIFPLLFLLAPLIRSTFSGFTIILPLYLPIFIQNLGNFPNWRNTFGPYGWFWLCVLVGGLAISLLKGQWEKYQGQKKGKPSDLAPKTESQGPSS